MSAPWLCFFGERGFGFFSDRCRLFGVGRDAWAGFCPVWSVPACAGSAMSVRRFDPCGRGFGLLLWRSSSALAVGFWPFGDDQHRRASVFVNGVAWPVLARPGVQLHKACKNLFGCC